MPKRWAGRRLLVLGALVAVVAVAVPSSPLLAAGDNDAPGSLVEDFSYPGAAQILTDDPRVKLISGDGHIILNATCAASADGVGRIVVMTTEGGTAVCFDVLAARGRLTMKIDAVYSIDGRRADDSGAATATASIQPEGGAEQSVTLAKNLTTPVGIGAGDDIPTTLLELAVSPT